MSEKRKLPIDRPCSACSAGDTEMEYHDHHPPFREPVSSPQDTRPLPHHKYKTIFHKSEADAILAERAAEPAAGMTPHIHECDHETEGEHVCRCVICGKHIGTPPSEGTTPQAERRAFEKWAEQFSGLVPLDRKDDNYRDLLTHFAWLSWQRRAARAVAPVETPDAERLELLALRKKFKDEHMLNEQDSDRSEELIEIVCGRAVAPVETPTRNSEVLADFVKYCEAHPAQRFWQALRNWSTYPFVMVSDGEKWRADTFDWEGRRHDK